MSLCCRICKSCSLFMDLWDSLNQRWHFQTYCAHMLGFWFISQREEKTSRLPSCSFLRFSLCPSLTNSCLLSVSHLALLCVSFLSARLSSDVGDKERVGHAPYESHAGCSFHHLSVSRSWRPKATLSGDVDGSVWTAEWITPPLKLKPTRKWQHAAKTKTHAYTAKSPLLLHTDAEIKLASWVFLTLLLNTYNIKVCLAPFCAWVVKVAT